MAAGHVHDYQRWEHGHRPNGAPVPFMVAGAGGYWHLARGAGPRPAPANAGIHRRPRQSTAQLRRQRPLLHPAHRPGRSDQAIRATVPRGRLQSRCRHLPYRVHHPAPAVTDTLRPSAGKERAARSIRPTPGAAFCRKAGHPSRHRPAPAAPRPAVGGGMGAGRGLDAPQSRSHRPRRRPGCPDRDGGAGSHGRAHRRAARVLRGLDVH